MDAGQSVADGSMPELDGGQDGGEGPRVRDAGLYLCRAHAVDDNYPGMTDPSAISPDGRVVGLTLVATDMPAVWDETGVWPIPNLWSGQVTGCSNRFVGGVAHTVSPAGVAPQGFRLDLQRVDGGVALFENRALSLMYGGGMASDGTLLLQRGPELLAWTSAGTVSWSFSPVLPIVNARGLAISLSGYVVGTMTVSPDGQSLLEHAFVAFDAGTVDLDSQGADSDARGVNEVGVIVGRLNRRPVVWDLDGGLRQLDMGSFVYGAAMSVTSGGDIVGVVAPIDAQQSTDGLGALWIDGGLAWAEDSDAGHKIIALVAVSEVGVYLGRCTGPDRATFHACRVTFECR
jgi:hypothetical protein